MFRILVLEDDVMIASGLTYALEAEGYAVSHAHSVGEASSFLSEEDFDLGILDMQLPDGRGDETGRKLLEKNVPVIYLTVEDEEAGIVKAFNEGAEDYVVKPFKIRELMARVGRTLNRGRNASDEIIKIGSVRINTSEGKVYAGEQAVELTALEYRILLIFAANSGKLLSRNQILEKIWDSEGNFVEDNTLTVYVKRLREKLGDSINIETVRGIGYRVGQ